MKLNKTVMRNLIYLIIVFLSFNSLSQRITIENFNSSELNRVLLNEINSYRKNKGLDTLVYSQVVFDSLSFPNCVEVSNSGLFYHPVITEKWKHSILREMIVSESITKVGGTVDRHSSGLPWLDTYENALRSYNNFTSYEQIAKFAISSWETSPSHNRVQNLDFDSGDLPGLFSCHSSYGKNGYVYIYINFVRVHRN